MATACDSFQIANSCAMTNKPTKALVL